MKGVQSILYAIQLKELTDQDLFDECMKNLYPHCRPATKQGCLIHELMERIETEEDENV